jgi:hypothetical protein
LFLKIRECGRTASARLERRALIRRYQLEPEHVVRVFEWRCASMSVGLRLLVPVSQCGCEPQIRRQLPRQIELHEASDPCVKPCSEPRPCRARRRISLSVGRKDGTKAQLDHQMGGHQDAKLGPLGFEIISAAKARRG